MVGDGAGFHTEGRGVSMEEFQKQAKTWWLSSIDFTMAFMVGERAVLEPLGVLCP